MAARPDRRAAPADAAALPRSNFHADARALTRELVERRLGFADLVVPVARRAPRWACRARARAGRRRRRAALGRGKNGIVVVASLAPSRVFLGHNLFNKL